MKIITPVLVLSSLLLLSGSSVFAADKDKSMLDALSEEAKETSMDEGNAPDEAISEPSIVPKEASDFSDLEGKIAAQIKGLLVDKSKNLENGEGKDSNFQNKLENIVSGALLKGNKLDDIRNAVSAAMVNIKSEGEGEANISEGSIESATKALKSIVGENKAIVNGDNQDTYIQSLQTELSDDAPKENDSKLIESTSKEVLKASASNNVSTTVSTKKPEVSVSATPAIASDEAKSEQTTTVLADTVTVLEGETLFKIAQRIYGSGANYLALYEENKDIIEDPNLIRVGQVLKIPR